MSFAMLGNREWLPSILSCPCKILLVNPGYLSPAYQGSPSTRVALPTCKQALNWHVLYLLARLSEFVRVKAS